MFVFVSVLFAKGDFRTAVVKKYDLDLNLFTGSNGETAGMFTLKLAINLCALNYQDKAVCVGVKHFILFMVMVIFINNGVVIFTTPPNEEEAGGETD